MNAERSQNAPLFSIKDLSLVFEQKSLFSKKQLHALSDINLSVNKGEFVALVGESGSGKTITALSAIGLLPKIAKVTFGEVFFDGTNLLLLSKKEMQKILGNRIAMIFQDPMSSLNPLVKIGKQIQETGITHGMTKQQSKEKALKLLCKMGVANPEYICSLYPKDLSGGMLQRVMIASSLMNDPKLLIADEPTTALDVTIQAEIIDLLYKLNKENGTSLLLISHDLSIVAKTCSRLYIMYGGKIVESGTTSDLLNKNAHPYTKVLLDAVCTFENRNKEIPFIVGESPSLKPENVRTCRFFERCPILENDPKQKAICKQKIVQTASVLTDEKIPHLVACNLYGENCE